MVKRVACHDVEGLVETCKATTVSDQFLKPDGPNNLPMEFNLQVYLSTPVSTSPRPTTST